MGIGRAGGKEKAELAAQAAIASPLLETSIDGARGVLINITSSADIDMEDVEYASSMISRAAHPDATIIWGAAFDDTMDDEISVTVIATGFEKTEETPVTPGLKTPVSTVPAGTVPPAAAPAEEKTPHAEPPQPLEMEEPKPEENDPFEDIFKIFQNRD